MKRERNERMTETFVAVGDALRRAAVPVYQVVMDRTPDLPRPAYLPQQATQTVAQYRASLAKLGRLGVAKLN